MTDRKKPGVAFWATVVVVVALAYPASFGPVCWIISRAPRHWSTPWVIANFVYSPILQAWNKRGPISPAIDRYANLASAAKLLPQETDGVNYLCITSDSP